MRTLSTTVLLSLSLIACTSTAPVGDSTSSSSASSVQNSRPLAKEGEFCGGIAAFQCEPGLTCQYDGDYPDAGGTCQKAR